MKPISFLFAFIISLVTAAHPGVGIVQDSKGNVYYTDLAQVWKISPEGKQSIVVAHVHTHELYMDESDNLFGEHLWYNGEQKNTWGYYVWRLSAAGKLEKVIPDTEGFRETYSFVRDHFGQMYWADRTNACQTVVRQNADHSTSTMGNHCFENIRKIESLPDGSVVLVDFQDVKKIDKQGRLTTVASKIADKAWTKSTISNQNSVMSVWSDARGNLYTAVSSLRSIKKFGFDGMEEVVFKSSFPWSPSGGMVDAKGNLWILECSMTNAVRVQRLSTDKTLKSF